MLRFKEFYMAESRGVSAKAQQAEDAAFKQVGKLLQGLPIVSPAGFDAGFPDFAFRVDTVSGGTIDLHFEYKANDKAQMGSMRDWIFDGKQFVNKDPSNEDKNDLIALMNSDRNAITNGKRLLKDLQTYFDPKVKSIYSGALSIIRDKKERFIKTQAFAQGTDNYQIAKVSNAQLGGKIVSHYKTKFKKNLKGGSKGSILFMMLKDKVWIVDTSGSVSSETMKEIADLMNVPSFSVMKNLKAQLEVRIQPRGLNSKGAKPTSIDVMASFRLGGAPSGGSKII